MAAIDFKKTKKELYRCSQTEFTIVDVPEMQFLMIDGHGDPNTSTGYQSAVNALYALAYGIRTALKDDPEHDTYVVPPLEGLWWAEDMTAFSLDNRADWSWTMMIMQPDWVTQDTFAAAQRTALDKKRAPADAGVRSALEQVRLDAYDEGLAAQILHIGPYDAEAPTIQALHTYIRAEGCDLTGKHHEIYLSDPRRTQPDKLRTILRQPLAPAEP